MFLHPEFQNRIREVEEGRGLVARQKLLRDFIDFWLNMFPNDKVTQDWNRVVKDQFKAFFTEDNVI